jgi:glycosyltransferase involved in cell wall biosynthesis
MPRKNLLFIPHAPPTRTLVTRGEALASGLAEEFNVHYLSWHYHSLEQASPLRRSVSRLLGLFKRSEVHTRGNLTVIATPFLYIRRRGTEFLRGINTAIVNNIIEKHAVDFVINELALVNSRNLARPHIIDIVDMPSARELERWSSQAVKAAGITTITGGLGYELKRYGMDAEVIGNGADFERFRRASGHGIRAQFGLEGRFVIGYIGNHAEWSGLLFLLDVFKNVRTGVPEACLLVVGPGTEIPRAKAKVRSEDIRDVVFTGPVEASLVTDYFRAIDLGVLPFELDPHANLSFPIKVIEYSAARKMVVASPLSVLREIRLPNVHLVDRRIDRWAETIVGLRNTEWRNEWDRHAEVYDWRKLAGRMADYVNARIA